MKLPRLDPTLLAVDAAIEKKENAERKRAYLGMSGVGHPCRRKLWYEFRWVEKSNFNAATLRRFADGHLGEDIMASRLKMLPGIELHTVDYGTGYQFEYKDVSGHFLGHMDGAISGLVQDPRGWYVWEHKQVDLKKLNKLEKLVEEKGEQFALAAWDWTYYIQAVLYMKYSGMSKHYLTVSSPGGREYISCITELLEPEQNAIDDTLSRAKKIIESPVPLDRVSEDPNYYICGWCDYKDLCHTEKAPQMNCRTCAHSTPIVNEEEDKGSWSCSMHEKVLSRTAQRKGCADHVFIPDIINLPVEEGSDEDNYVGYKLPSGKVFYNSNHDGSRCFTSEELYAIDNLLMLDDEEFHNLLKGFDATIAVEKKEDDE